MSKCIYLRLSAIRITLLVGFCALISGLIIKSVSDYNHSKERGRFVLSILRQHQSELHQLSKNGESNLNLQSWLVQQIFASSGPSSGAENIIDQRLLIEKINHKELNTALFRWKFTLDRWRTERGKFRRTEKYSQSPEEILKEARLHYYEATGYQKIGRTYDATVLYLWSFDLLSSFIAASPFSTDIPEALFLLGVSQMRLRKALPSNVRSDRLLNLCVELYPDSIWANLARDIVREEIENEV